MCATRSRSSTAPIFSTTAGCSRKARPPKSSLTAMCAASIWARNSRCRASMAGVGQRLEIRQGQSLVMTPQLQQAIKLLQLSNIELTEYCETELERNPLLERDDRESGPVGEVAEAPVQAAAGERADERCRGMIFPRPPTSTRRRTRISMTGA